MRILIAINQARVLYDFKRELVEALCARGDELFFSFEEDFRTSAFVGKGTIVTTPIEPRGLNPLKDVKLYLFYRKLLKRLRPDLVLTFTVKPNAYCGRACRATRTPYVATISGLGTAFYGGEAKRRIATALYRGGLRGAARVFAQNAAIAKRLIDERMARADRIVATRGSGVNLERFEYVDYPSADSPTRLLFIGRLMRDKGVVELIECARRVRKTRPDVVFQMLGATERGCDVHYLTFNAANAGIVEYLGYQEDVREALAAASAVALPSYHEGLSNALLEGAAVGRPILASRIPGCVETFDEGETGFGFEPRSVDSLVEAVERFLATPFERRREMGRLGRAKIEREFSRADVVAQYLREIDAVAAESRKR
ncbi:MAG: glycosyltransferase family 4 protein [Thermoguttaceae bacterium]|nr:glycosyltransferase family 4 protein [Thermoguttaceae bacterium]